MQYNKNATCVAIKHNEYNATKPATRGGEKKIICKNITNVMNYITKANSCERSGFLSRSPRDINRNLYIYVFFNYKLSQAFGLYSSSLTIIYYNNIFGW